MPPPILTRVFHELSMGALAETASERSRNPPGLSVESLGFFALAVRPGRVPQSSASGDMALSVSLRPLPWAKLQRPQENLNSSCVQGAAEHLPDLDISFRLSSGHLHLATWMNSEMPFLDTTRAQLRDTSPWIIAGFTLLTACSMVGLDCIVAETHLRRCSNADRALQAAGLDVVVDLGKFKSHAAFLS